MNFEDHNRGALEEKLYFSPPLPVCACFEHCIPGIKSGFPAVYERPANLWKTNMSRAGRVVECAKSLQNGRVTNKRYLE